MNSENNSNISNNISVTISNVKYNLSTTENEGYVKGLASYVNSKISKLGLEYPSLPRYSTSFLTLLSLNITDDLFKQRKLFTASFKNLENLNSKDVSVLKELEFVKNKNDKLNQKLLKKDETLKFLNDQINSLKGNKDLVSNLEADLELAKLSLKELSENHTNDIASLNSLNDLVVSDLTIALKEKDIIIENLKDNLSEVTSKLSSLDEKDLQIADLTLEVEKLKKIRANYH